MPKKPATKNTLYQPVITRKEVDGSHYYYVDNKFVPGVTTILHDTLPTPVALRQWIGDVGNEKAQQKLERAGERGTSIHNACEALLKGEEINLEKGFPNKADKKCVASFVNWVYETNPVIADPAHIEATVASVHGYAGTLDIFCYIDDEPWIIDIKTSSGVYDAHKLQIKAYQQAWYEMTGIMAKTGILHLNYRTKRGYSLIEKMTIGGRELEFGDFLKVFDVYKMLNGGEVPEPPTVDTYPSIISLYKKEVA